MNRTDASEPSAPLIALGDQDAAACAAYAAEDATAR
jgi:hypothetical protein